jgi:2-keto-3-deoxy-L-rhamnonate aldolase RhmA
MKNLLKQKIREGKFTIGTFISIPNLEIAEVTSKLGFDFIVIDMEHSPFTIEMVEQAAQVIEPNTTPLVRVPWNDFVAIKQALDAGAHGIVVPWVNTKEEAIKAVKACKYPPEGIRGFGPRRQMILDEEYAKTANKEILLCVQIETQKAIDNIDKIVSVNGVDMVMVGPYDLSMSLGIFGQFKNKKFKNVLKKVAEGAKKQGKVATIFTSAKDSNKYISLGYTSLTLGADLFVLANAYKQELVKARKAIKDAGLKV